MKSKLNLLATLTLMFLAARAQAVIVLQDNFSAYSAGPIVTQSKLVNGPWFSPPGDPAYGTLPTISVDGVSSVVIAGTNSTANQPWAYFTNGLSGFSFTGGGTGDTNNIFFFTSNAPVSALYISYMLTVTTNTGGTPPPTLGSGTYFMLLTDTNFDYRARAEITTNGAAAGNFRIGILNGAAPSTPAAAEIVQQDLSLDTTYQVVVRYVLSSGLATLWVNPANETTVSGSISPAATDSTNVVNSVVAGGSSAFITDTGGAISNMNSAICALGLRNTTGMGQLTISQLTVGTSFSDVVPATDGQNPPYISVQPQAVTNFAGQPATFSVVAGGDQDTLTYQWSVGGSAITGANSNTYTIPSLVATNAGTYSVLVANAANPVGITSFGVDLTVLPSDIAPVITTAPTNLTVTAGAGATFNVTASDNGAPIGYQWFLGAKALTGETTPTLTIASTVISNAGTYKVVVTNIFGDSTNASATLTVNPPAPIVATIQFLRSTLDNTNFNTNGAATLYTVTGTNTSWNDLTTAGNSEFFIQDATAGIAVFWSGAAAATHQPPAGAVVTVTGPLSDFDGLLEIEPVFTNTFHSVTYSNVGALPAPMPLPFDPFIVTNGNVMQKHLVGSYFVASNVFLTPDAGSIFSTSANDPLTNGFLANQVITENLFTETSATAGTRSVITGTNKNGQTSIIFYGSHTDVGGTAQPTGPLTIYGVLSIFNTAVPYTSGYEFTPTRLADIVPAVTITNVISNIIRYGDQATNTFSANVLQPGETLTMNVVASDPGGGSVTVSGLTGNGVWSTVAGNGTVSASATYTYTATVPEEGTTDNPTLTVAFSSSGYSGSYTNFTIYVPTPDEQSVRISEVFANPTTNTASAAYNPLKRGAADTLSVAVNDQYIELASLNPSDTVFINHFTIHSGGPLVYTFANGESLPPGTSGVVYGGDSTVNPPTLNNPSLSFLDKSLTGLTLSTNGGTVSLFNNTGSLIDRVVYPASTVAGSFSRFLSLNGPLVPQAYINTNLVTPGAQYDGGSWSSPTTLPTGVAPTISYSLGKPVVLNFIANPAKASTLWQANKITDPFFVTFGQQFSNTLGAFTITNPPSSAQFYYVTTQ